MKTVEAELRRRGERERNAIFFKGKKTKSSGCHTAHHPQTMTTQGPKVKTVFRDE